MMRVAEGALLSGNLLRFDRQVDPDGRPWPPSKRVLKQGGKTLYKSGRLFDSITSESGPDFASVGTNMIYGNVHQFGFDGDVAVRAHVRRVRGRDVWGQGEGRGRRKQQLMASGVGFVRAHTRRMRIPPRPFLGMSGDDATEIIQRFTDLVEKRLP
jgi:phage virion morphogenesis protein